MVSSKQKMTSRVYFKSLTLFHTALCPGQVLFAGMIFFLRWSGKTGPGRNMGPFGQNEQYFYIALGVVFASILTSYYLYMAKVTRARERGTLSDIMNEYRSAVIFRDACIQGPSSVASLAYFITGTDRYLALTGLIVLVFLVWWPTPAKAVNDLQLDGEYRARVEEPDAIL